MIRSHYILQASYRPTVSQHSQSADLKVFPRFSPSKMAHQDHLVFFGNICPPHHYVNKPNFTNQSKAFVLVVPKCLLSFKN